MPLTVVRSDSNAALWRACASRFLDELESATDPIAHPTHLWIAHRTQRDLLLAAAEERGLAGWLAPPVSFLSELPERFGIERRPLGPLTTRLLLARIAGAVAREQGFDEGGVPGRSHVIDRLLSELLPEGVAPERLAAALEAVAESDFASARNEWTAEVVRRYATEVESTGRVDPRALPAMIATRVEEGGLPEALGGATRLHVYGVATLRGRSRLYRALAAQSTVDVRVYLASDVADGEWESLADAVEDVRAGRTRPVVDVQPAPDAVREAAWVAREIKRTLLSGDVEPHEIAVIARSGREDTRRIREALRRAGVPSTARVRSPLSEVPALRAALGLFEAVAADWSWATLRPVIKSPYFRIDVDVRPLDFLSTRARPSGLAGWIEGIDRLRVEAGSDRGWVLARAGVSGAALEEDLAALRSLAERARGLDDPRTEDDWIELTRRLLRGEPFGMRDRVSEPVEDRWDVVRLDQRAVLAVDALLREWRELPKGRNEPIDAGAWLERFRRALDANEIALSTPLQRGVQVLEAHEAPLTPFRRVFLVHANDGVFPRRYAGGLFSEEERAALRSDGIPVSTRDLRLERERRLWRACIGSARVTVSYWTADANGVPRLASLFVPTHDRSDELPRTRRRPTEPGDEPVTRAELLESELNRWIELRRKEDATPFRTPAPHLLRRAALTAFADELRTGGLDRFAEPGLGPPSPDPGLDAPMTEAAALFGNERPLSERPTPWNGEIRDPLARSAIAARYHERYEWSASQLEQYGRRPFDHLVERVLGFSELDETEDEASRLTLGGLVHEVLERFYAGIDPTELVDAGADSPAQLRFDRTFREVCDRYEAAEDRWIGVPYVWAATRQELYARLSSFVRWELGQSDGARPLAVELEFGGRTDRGPADLSGLARDGVERTLLLGGRVDRIDRIGSDGGRGLRVVDYKSGGAGSAPSPRAFEDGAALQSPLYMAAVEALGLGAAIAGVYRTIRAPANRARRRPADVGPALELARLIPARIRAGLFEAVQARSTELRDWQPGRDIARTAARLGSGTRFDPLAPARVPGAAMATHEDREPERAP